MKKEKVKFSKIIVSIIIALVVGFTGAVLYVFLRTGSEPTVLVTCFFGFVIGELWQLTSIRKKEIDKES